MENKLVIEIQNEKFKKEVLDGLTSYPKSLPSKYFYDKKGDVLFQQIMAMPSYYLTDCEFEILETHTEAIAKHLFNSNPSYDLIELGAGDGKKTKILLQYLVANKQDFVYKPIDISKNAIDSLALDLENYLPDLNVKGEVGMYFDVLEKLKESSNRNKAILVLGSNIGNLEHEVAISFLSKIADTMTQGDRLFMGFDQKKHPQVILDAYNDATGITAAFNKNILERINRELGANFNLDKFKHWETYNPETGTAKSFLVATEPMNVHIGALDKEIAFEAWETIHTEISQKYDDKVVTWLAEQAGLEILKCFTCGQNFYKNYIFKSIA